MYFDGCVILGRFFGEAVGVFTVHALGCLAPRIAEKLAHVPPALQVGPVSRGLVIGRQAHGSIRGIAERKSLTQDPLEAHFHFRESFFFFFLHHTPFFCRPNLWKINWSKHTSRRCTTTVVVMSTQPLLQTAPGTSHPRPHPAPILTQLPGKRIALPTRVEPKVFFANERTFLSWLNFTVILGGLAVGLLNFGDKIGKISAGLFTFVAMAAMAYALFTFHWRARSIRMRGQGGFDDRLGPTVLTIALFCAVVVNFVLRLTVDNQK
jgi:uncharacterized membrane protein YidH (DUF202 family)